MSLSYKDLVEKIGKKAIKQLFKNGHPSAFVDYKIGQWTIVWDAFIGRFWLS